MRESVREYLVLWIALLRGLTNSIDVARKSVAYIFSNYIARRHTPENLNLEIRNICIHFLAVAYPGIFFRGGGFQQIPLRTEERDNGDLGAVAP